MLFYVCSVLNRNFTQFTSNQFTMSSTHNMRATHITPSATTSLKSGVRYTTRIQTPERGVSLIRVFRDTVEPVLFNENSPYQIIDAKGVSVSAVLAVFKDKKTQLVQSGLVKMKIDKVHNTCEFTFFTENMRLKLPTVMQHKPKLINMLSPVEELYTKEIDRNFANAFRACMSSPINAYLSSSAHHTNYSTDTADVSGAIPYGVPFYSKRPISTANAQRIHTFVRVMNSQGQDAVVNNKGQRIENLTVNHIITKLGMPRILDHMTENRAMVKKVLDKYPDTKDRMTRVGFYLVED